MYTLLEPLGGIAAAGGFLVAYPAMPDAVRLGDRVVGRTEAGGAPVTAAFRVVGRDSCGEGCTELIGRAEAPLGALEPTYPAKPIGAARPAVQELDAVRLRGQALVGRVVYAVDAPTGSILDLRGGGAGRATTVVDEYNRWRPRVTAEDLAAALNAPPRPVRLRRRPLVQF